MAPVTDSIRSFVFLAAGCAGGGGGGGCGLGGGGGLDGNGFPFFDGGVAADAAGCCCCDGGSGGGGLTIAAGGVCFSSIVVVVVVIVPKRSTLALSDVTKMLDDWLVKTLVAGVFILSVAPNTVLGAVLSTPKEANGLVDSTDAGGS